MTTLIDLLRHGEPLGGARYRGSTDDALSETGWHQMWQAVAHASWDAIVSSPLQRCAAFAQALARQRNVALTIDARLREIHFGDWEGRSAAQLHARQPAALARYWENPAEHTPPNGEPLAEFTARVRAAWQDICQRHAGRHVLLIAHGGTLRAILGHTLGMPQQAWWRLALPYACLSRVEAATDDAVAQLIFHGGRP